MKFSTPSPRLNLDGTVKLVLDLLLHVPIIYLLLASFFRTLSIVDAVMWVLKQKERKRFTKLSVQT